jgi:hypoxanthine phosphoribosyltransferase
MGKTYISAEEVQYQSNILANDIIKLVKVSDFNPTRLISLARGGLAIAQYIHGALNRAGIRTKFMTARTESYDNAGNQGKTVEVHGIEYIVKCSTSIDQFLIVDDIFDSGQSVLALINKLKRKMGDQYPSNVQIATLFWKPTKNTTDLVPNFFVKSTEDWIVFPHEVDELTIEEIRQFMGQKMAALFAEQRIGESASSSSAVDVDELPLFEDDPSIFDTPLYVTGRPAPSKSAFICEAQNEIFQEDAQLLGDSSKPVGFWAGVRKVQQRPDAAAAADDATSFSVQDVHTPPAPVVADTIVAHHHQTVVPEGHDIEWD